MTSQRAAPAAGQKIGMLRIVDLGAERVQSNTWLTVRCDCGSPEKAVQWHNLRCGNTVSCGCKREAARRTARAPVITPGMRFGRLTVSGCEFKDQQNRKFVPVLCACGETRSVACSALRAGYTKSCGCLGRETRGALQTHGKASSRVYRIWAGMVQRVTNQKCPKYPDYGGRGIDIDPRWVESFEAFYSDMGDPPSPRHSLDRRENNAGYWRHNCRWATAREQMRNIRTNVKVEFQGKEMLLLDILKTLDLTRSQVDGWRKRHRATWQQSINHYVELSRQA